MKLSKQNKKEVIKAEELLSQVEGGSNLNKQYQSLGAKQDEKSIEVSGPEIQIYGTSLAN